MVFLSIYRLIRGRTIICGLHNTFRPYFFGLRTVRPAIIFKTFHILFDAHNEDRGPFYFSLLLFLPCTFRCTFLCSGVFPFCLFYTSPLCTWDGEVLSENTRSERPVINNWSIMYDAVEWYLLLKIIIEISQQTSRTGLIRDTSTFLNLNFF